jgi:NAD(P)-dependent dehydrogenase (short-subunit alcohol dehydrogenase family)
MPSVPPSIIIIKTMMSVVAPQTSSVRYCTSMIMHAFRFLLFLNAVGISVALKPPNVIIVGGSSGMGKAAALSTVKNGGKCLLVSRSEQKLKTAKAYLMGKVENADIQTAVLDATDERAVAEFAGSLQDERWDSLVISAAGKAPHGPMAELPTSDTREMFESKFWGAYHCAKYFSEKLREGGCVVFVAGILNRRPGLNCVPLAISNGALEALTKSLALEWGPRLRVNCLSPGFCETERFDHMSADRKAKMMSNTAASLPLQRVGEPNDMGDAIYYLLTAQFCTGVILDVDGGHGIRQ